MARFTVPALARPADDVDLSDITTARRTGPAQWVPDVMGVLEIPFDRDLTDTETAAITDRLTAANNTQATLKANLRAYLAISSPTAATSAARVKDLIRLLIDQ